jgi:putative Mg2+ transporter-C (MgtC) family protein
MILMDELLSLPDSAYLSRVIFRLGAAAVLGGLIGAEREYLGKSAGLRTHMTVSLGCAAFVLIAIESNNDAADLSRAIQGVAAGIGFIGAGAILKRTDKEDIQGLTTAATLWLTAAVGVAAGAGKIWLGLIAVSCAFVILTIMAGVGRWLHKKGPAPEHDPRS